MSDVAPFDRHRRFTDMSVMEFALLIALMRAGPHPLAFLLPTLDAWFDCKLGVSDLEPTAGRLMCVCGVRYDRSRPGSSLHRAFSYIGHTEYNCLISAQSQQTQQSTKGAAPSSTPASWPPSSTAGDRTAI